MHLERWNPFRELQEMSERLNKLFNVRDFWSKEPFFMGDWCPTVDIVETPEEYLIKADLPEVKKEDVRVTLEEGMLRIEGERKQEKEEKGRKFHRIERSYGTFARTFSLPSDIEESKILAEFKEGVLTLRVAKLPMAKKKMVEVKVL